MFSWAKSLNLSWLVEDARVIAGSAEFMNNMHFIYSFPYALWVTSFCCFVGSVWHRDRSFGAMVWRIAAPVIAIGSEILQLAGLLPGRFDVIDLVVLVIASIVGFVFSLL